MKLIERKGKVVVIMTMTREEASVLLKMMFAFWANTHEQTNVDMEMALNIALTALRSMSETTKPGWISVKERLPNFGIPVLICWDGYTDIAEYLCGMVCPKWRTQHYGTIDLTSVTHWMPLPEPPEEG